MISPTSLSATDEGAGASPKVQGYTDTISRAKQAVQDNKESKTFDQGWRNRSEKSPVRATIEAAQREFLTEDLKQRAIDAYISDQQDVIFERVRKEHWEELKAAVKSDSRDEIWEESRFQMYGEIKGQLRKELHDEVVAELKKELRAEVIEILKEELRKEAKAEFEKESAAIVAAAATEDENDDSEDRGSNSAIDGTEPDSAHEHDEGDTNSDARQSPNSARNGNKRRFSETEHAPTPDVESELYNSGTAKRRVTEALLAAAVGKGAGNLAPFGAYAKYLVDEKSSTGDGSDNEKEDDIGKDGKLRGDKEEEEEDGEEEGEEEEEEGDYEEEDDLKADEEEADEVSDGVLNEEDANVNTARRRYYEDGYDDDSNDEEDQGEEDDMQPAKNNSYGHGVQGAEEEYTDDEEGEEDDEGNEYDEDEDEEDEREIKPSKVVEQRKISAAPAVIDLSSDDD